MTSRDKTLYFSSGYGSQVLEGSSVAMAAATEYDTDSSLHDSKVLQVVPAPALLLLAH
jgi:hypothetical protein